MNGLSPALDTVIFQSGNLTVTLATALIAAGVVVLVLLAVVVIVMSRGASARRAAQAAAEHAAQVASEQSAQAQQSLAELMKAQNEMQGRMATMAELFGARQAELNKAIGERLDGMTQRIGVTMTEQTRATHENLTKLQERLAVIDTAQNNIQTLAKDVVGLQAILSNKQTRGAFGQSRMEAIVADGLPMGGYTFQATLSNGSRPDCIIHMPNDSPALVIDAKFPLEAWNAIRASEDPNAAKQAATQFRRDMEVHIRDISEKYLITGETQDTAFLFVPSESIFAEIHENFEGIVQRAHKARIVIVSPSLLMLSIQVVQAILKDARMREQAHLIQGEVMNLMKDLSLLDDRVAKLANHFGQSQRDIEQIQISTGKLTKRGEKIGALEFEQPARKGESEAKEPKAAEGAGRLKLRVVDED